MDLLTLPTTLMGAATAALLSVTPAPAPPDREVVFWESVRDTANPAELREFLVRYPGGTFNGLARLRLQNLESNAAFPDTLARQFCIIMPDS